MARSNSAKFEAKQAGDEDYRPAKRFWCQHFSGILTLQVERKSNTLLQMRAIRADPAILVHRRTSRSDEAYAFRCPKSLFCTPVTRTN